MSSPISDLTISSRICGSRRGAARWTAKRSAAQVSSCTRAALVQAAGPAAAGGAGEQLYACRRQGLRLSCRRQGQRCPAGAAHTCVSVLPRRRCCAMRFKSSASSSSGAVTPWSMRTAGRPAARERSAASPRTSISRSARASLVTTLVTGSNPRTFGVLRSLHAGSSLPKYSECQAVSRLALCHLPSLPKLGAVWVALLVARSHGRRRPP